MLICNFADKRLYVKGDLQHAIKDIKGERI